MSVVKAVQALYDFEAQQDGQLSFNEGDILFLLNDHDETNADWWIAKTQDDDQGYVPSNYFMDAPILGIARVLYNYTSESDSSWHLEEGMLVKILDMAQKDWWLIQYESSCGLAPANYLEQVDFISHENDDIDVPSPTEYAAHDWPIDGKVTNDVTLSGTHPVTNTNHFFTVKDLDDRKKNTKKYLAITSNAIELYIDKEQPPTEIYIASQLRVFKWVEGRDLYLDFHTLTRNFSINKRDVTDLQSLLSQLPTSSSIPRDSSNTNSVSEEPIVSTAAEFNTEVSQFSPQTQPMDSPLTANEEEATTIDSETTSSYHSALVQPTVDADFSLPPTLTLENEEQEQENEIEEREKNEEQEQQLQQDIDEEVQPDTKFILPVYALFDFDARTQDELSCRQGDSLQILDDSDNTWWLCQCLSTHQQGYLPRHYLSIKDKDEEKEREGEREEEEEKKEVAYVENEQERENKAILNDLEPQNLSGSSSPLNTYSDTQRHSFYQQQETSLDHQSIASLTSISSSTVSDAPPPPLPERIHQQRENREIPPEESFEKLIERQRVLSLDADRRGIDFLEQRAAKQAVPPIQSPPTMTAIHPDLQEKRRRSIFGFMLKKKESADKEASSSKEKKHSHHSPPSPPLIPVPVLQPTHIKPYNNKDTTRSLKSQSSTKDKEKQKEKEKKIMNRSIQSASQSPSKMNAAPRVLPDSKQVRCWTDVSGRHQTEAAFVGRDGPNRVRLHKTNGIFVSVPLTACSIADQQWIATRHPLGFDWYQFMMDCGVDARASAQYAQTLMDRKLDGSMLGELLSDRTMLPSLGITLEGDLIRIRRGIEKRLNIIDTASMSSSSSKSSIATSSTHSSMGHIHSEIGKGPQPEAVVKESSAVMGSWQATPFSAVQHRPVDDSIKGSPSVSNPFRSETRFTTASPWRVSPAVMRGNAVLPAEPQHKREAAVPLPPFTPMSDDKYEVFRYVNPREPSLLGQQTSESRSAAAFAIDGSPRWWE